MPEIPPPAFPAENGAPGARTRSPLVLAFIGDAVYNLYVRTEIIARRDLTPHSLHVLCSKIVCAKAQALCAERLYESFTEQERDAYRRGKNSKPGTIPKNADPGDYARATGLEAVIGYLYLRREDERMAELLSAALKTSMEVL